MDPSQAFLAALRELAAMQEGAIASSSTGPIQFLQKDPLRHGPLMHKHFPEVDPIDLDSVEVDCYDALVTQGFLVLDEDAGGWWVDLERSLPEVS